MPSRIAFTIATLVAGTLMSCGGSRSASPTSSPASTTSAQVRPAMVSTSGPTTTLPAGVSLVAQATVGHLEIFADPGASAPDRTLDSPWRVDPEVAASLVPQVFLVETNRADGWVEVLLPVRPNGSTGWVRSTDVSLSRVTFRVKVELGARRITVFDLESVLYQGPIAVGAAATPTPTGRYFIRVLIRAPNPNTVYGPYAYGLSSHSDALTTFNGGDAEIGIHGNNDASVLGRDATHGCIRMDNSEITRLAAILPLGTPVEIVA